MMAVKLVPLYRGSWLKNQICVFVGTSILGVLHPAAAATPKKVSYSVAPARVETYDYVEITASVETPDAHDPFEDATLSGTFEREDGKARWRIEGFCDSTDGTTFRIRFMPSQSGSYRYSVTYQQGAFQSTSSGTFLAFDAHRRGPIRIDPKYPWHFIWEGTGEHYFFNGTTAYWLVGWRDEHTIEYSLDRLQKLKVNRLRVTLAGRTDAWYGEPVMMDQNWTVFSTPWPRGTTGDIMHHGLDYSRVFANPRFDYSRFDVSYWQKFERMLRYARERNMIISVVLDMNDSGIHPTAGSEDEYRFIRYAVARFGAFSNITWDLGDDVDSYREEKWTHETGTLLEQWDANKHLATSHPVHTIHQDRASPWFGFTSYQDWSRNQHSLMLESRKLQEKTGRIIPQTNEEYGYEDHYPVWAIPASDSSDVLRRTAWDIAMAGGYQTAGETARRGTNIWPDTGGGWMNGRGDDTMTMFLGYGHMIDFFTSFEWWKANPHDELVNSGNYCLAEPGKLYAVYLPHGGRISIQLQPGHYEANWFSGTTGERINLPTVEGGRWTSPETPDHNDWALLLRAD
jgi:Protein of unknown function (DUF4038)/Domain of unknown function (DUF5060)